MAKGFPTYELETIAKERGFKYIIGVDECGRGSGLSVVTSAAVNVPIDFVSELEGKVNDSKKLSAKKREALFDLITENCEYGIHHIDNKTIDEINILEATKFAMAGAVNKISKCDYLLIDGPVDLSKLIFCEKENVLKGDTKSISIAAASIVAKVTRDRMMEKLHEEYPIYGINKHKGYLTKGHIEALKLYGPCEYHRLTFNKVKECI